MSGREHEPVAAFFPSIDRNLIRDLDRHLRGGKPAPERSTMPTLSPAAPLLPQGSSSEAFVAPPTALPHPTPETVASPTPTRERPAPLDRTSPRPNIAGVLEAVENAAHSLAAMTSRIEELEAELQASEVAARHYETQLAEADQAHRELEGKLAETVERAERSEALAAQQGARAVDLERDLATVHADLARVTEAITVALGMPHEHGA